MPTPEEQISQLAPNLRFGGHRCLATDPIVEFAIEKSTPRSVAGWSQTCSKTTAAAHLRRSPTVRRRRPPTSSQEKPMPSSSLAADIGRVATPAAFGHSALDVALIGYQDQGNLGMGYLASVLQTARDDGGNDRHPGRPRAD